uniref:Uncharacterized protein n=1 Tax=Ananas comosus var. bracteatus TaxID=296719 RepID=A0A6V7QH73_ANACO|nr:unnamed protein product [Ananas comosus var. bracteatus]
MASNAAYASITVRLSHPTAAIRLRIPGIPTPVDSRARSPLQIPNCPFRCPQTPSRSQTPAMARVAVILAVILSLFVLSHARLSAEPTTTTAAAATTSSETSTDADPEPSETVDPTVHVYPINQIGDGALPAGDILRHIDFSLRRPIYHHRHHFRHFHGHRRHRMRAMEIALGADAVGLPGDRIPLRSSEEKGLVKEEGEEEKPTEEEEKIEKREGDSDSDSDSDDDEEEKIERMEKRKRNCKKNKKKHHLRRFHHHHHHHRHEQDEAEKIGFMKRFWDFLNRF